MLQIGHIKWISSCAFKWKTKEQVKSKLVNTRSYISSFHIRSYCVCTYDSWDNCSFLKCYYLYLIFILHGWKICIVFSLKLVALVVELHRPIHTLLYCLVAVLYCSYHANVADPLDYFCSGLNFSHLGEPCMLEYL